MKKKIYSIITMMMVLFACVLTSACGDRYSKMEFRILYAYSQDSGEWFDGTDGISLNYNQENLDGEGDETSLVFNEDGKATLYVKIEVKNIKRKKYVDLNVELRHEIEAKNQLNEIRIQKKVKEANSEEIQKLNEHLKQTNEKIDELIQKIDKEVEKIKNFSNDIIKELLRTMKLSIITINFPRFNNFFVS